MGTIWTPSGEQPVGDEGWVPGPGEPPGEPPEELEAELAEVQRQLLETPASVIIANHAIGLFQLAALHLNQQPANLVDAQLAIDALGSLVEGLGDRLGPDEDALRDALAQIRLAFVQIKSAGGTPPQPEAGEEG
ncbi:MAG: hypothetical protein JOZ04_13450, partial [Acidimicrobiia bacterium]|nr:hypothetical protein [Acidimicrobiia bacterium]